MPQTARRPARRPAAPPDQRNLRLALACTRDGRPRYQIGAAAQINASLFGRILSGREQPSPEIRRRIAAALGVAEHEIFDDSAPAA